MSLLDRSRLEIKLGEYATAPATALADPLLLSRVQDYRRQTQARMLPLGTSDIREKLPASDYHVSRKIDGEFNVLVYDQGETIMVNPGGTVRTGLPLLAEAAGQFQRAGLKRALVAGELHYLRPDGKRPRVHDVSRAARQPESTTDLDALHFAAFDLMQVNGDTLSAEFNRTWQQLNALLPGTEHVAPVEAVTAKDVAEVENQVKRWIDQGAEGAVVRSDAAGLFKVKPRHTIDVGVIGFTEGTEDRQGLLHDLLLALMRPDGTFHVLGRVGGGFSEEDRRTFLSDLKDMVVASDYAEVNDQVAYQMVRPEWVIEISVLDMIAQSTRGAPINRMVLNWNRGSSCWEVLRRMPLVALISPQFIRRRDDKRITPIDLRVQQVADIVEVPLIDRDARQFTLSPSTVLRREVYTKVLKDKLMVRKLVMWQTNKDKESEDYPAYVIHFTDFSPNRKTPLERELRVSSSRDQIGHLWDALAEENVKKGWSLANQNIPAPASPPPPVPVAAPSQVPKQESPPVPVQAAPPEAPPKPAPAEKPTARKAAHGKSGTGAAAKGEPDESGNGAGKAPAPPPSQAKKPRSGRKGKGG
jgi:ATP-dependent DNA ligase